jgi:hypothetical protein
MLKGSILLQSERSAHPGLGLVGYSSVQIQSLMIFQLVPLISQFGKFTLGIEGRQPLNRVTRIHM